MKNFRKIFAALLMVCMMICICACGNDGATNQGSENNKPGSEVESTLGSDKENEKESVDDGKIEYIVKVVDADGTPIANVYVQLCDDGSCYLPVATDASGVATFRMDEGTYKAAVSVTPEGYVDVAGEYFYFDGDSTEVTITLQKAA